MRQIIYISTTTASFAAHDTDAILKTSQRNNTRDAISGLLFTDGKRFLQALEGESSALERAMTRIKWDARHRAIVLLSDRVVDAREFGDWAMAARAPGADADEFLARVADLVAGASPAVRATFTGFAEVRRAA